MGRASNAVVGIALGAAVIIAQNPGILNGLPGVSDYHSQVSPAARVAVRFERHRLGCPYYWGGTGPCESGYDCSGLTVDAWAAAGVYIPRTSEEQWAKLPHVSTPAPGDLVFSYWPKVDSQPSPNHVQMYVGHGYVIGADSTNVERVRLSTDNGHIVGFARP